MTMLWAAALFSALSVVAPTNTLTPGILCLQLQMLYHVVSSWLQHVIVWLVAASCSELVMFCPFFGTGGNNVQYFGQWQHIVFHGGQKFPLTCLKALVFEAALST